MTKQVTVDTAILCDLCQGKGTNGDSKPVACETCGGRGEVQSVQRSFLGQVMTSRPCPTCRGVGEVIPDPCHKCGGDGRVRARRDISVKVPAGVGGGMRIRLAAQGEVGPGGGPAGDLYVEVHEQPHEMFVRDGDDLHCTISVPMVDAALGTTVTVNTIIDGPTEITIPAGTQPGSVEGCAGTACRSCVPGCAATCTRTSRSWCRRAWTKRTASCCASSRICAPATWPRSLDARTAAPAADCSPACAKRSAVAERPVPTTVFYLDPLPEVGELAVLDGKEGRHAATVRRIRPGERLVLADGRGGLAASSRRSARAGCRLACRTVASVPRPSRG